MFWRKKEVEEAQVIRVSEPDDFIGPLGLMHQGKKIKDLTADQLSSELYNCMAESWYYRLLIAEVEKRIS